MKTLSDIKRRCVVGQKLQLTYHWINNPNLPLQVGAIRSIQKSLATKTQFSPLPNKTEGSWLAWPKASDVKVISDNEFHIYEDGKLALGYKFVE